MINRANTWGQALKRALPRLPLLDWGRRYDRQTFKEDATAAAIVSVLLIPQSLAYALLAGMPAQTGLYMSILPALLYALLGSSGVMAVGPVALTSLLTAAAIGNTGYAAAGPAAYATAAAALALLSGVMLLLMGLLRLGTLVNFLSHPVMSAFVSATSVVIIFSQVKVVLGLPASSTQALPMLSSLVQNIHQVHGLTLAVGASSLLLLWWTRKSGRNAAVRLGLGKGAADLLCKAMPLVVIVIATAFSAALNWQTQGLKVVGTVASALPPFTPPGWDLALWRELALPALLISVVGFVGSLSVGQTLAARRRERIEPDQELVALGASNVGAAFTGGFPVTGGFSRSVINFDAGARTPAASAFTALGIGLIAFLFSHWLHHIPQAVLAASIIAAVLSLVDWSMFKRTWAFAKSDFWAAAITFMATLLAGLEAGLSLGVVASLALHLHRSSRPHIASVGWVPGTEHFRNINRHAVRTSPRLLSLRMDESLYFANARALEDRINNEVAQNPELQHVVLLCSAINDVDDSAVQSLTAIQHRLADAGIALHLSELKGPVMDKLRATPFLQRLPGPVFLTHYQAIQSLTPDVLVN